MRWASFDQKPALFNNTALDGSYTFQGYQPRIKEISAASQQRFKICTCVHTDILDQPDTLPPVGVLYIDSWPPEEAAAGPWAPISHRLSATLIVVF